ncbi:MAG TPA: polysaccharide deacetylase family protein, partial [Anaerovoracaceae bacterium]|nr:polysaccharide deacetylase family protein [Anaerovoracaceae bacterium]
GIVFILLPSNLKLSVIYSLDNINCISEIVSNKDVHSNSGNLHSNSGNLQSGDKYIIITFDDGWKSQYDAYERLKQLNFKATLYICSSLIDKEDRLTLENIEEMYDGGWDVCNHTVHHTNLTEVSEKKAYEEVYGCSAWIYGHGFTRHKGYKHFAYPEGAYDDNIIKMLEKQGFMTARTTIPGSNTTKVLELGRASLYGMSKKNIRDLVLSDQEIVIISLHRMIPDDAKEVTELDLKESYFDELIHSIADSKRQVITMTEWYELNGQDIDKVI